MKFDKKQYQKLKEIDKINLNSHSDFWKEYVHTIDLELSKNSYLGCFLYPSSKRSNSDRAVLSILNNHFKLLGWEHNYFDKHIGAITGIMYLYQVN